jgi:hypothetical protein
MARQAVGGSATSLTPFLLPCLQVEQNVIHQIAVWIAGCGCRAGTDDASWFYAGSEYDIGCVLWHAVHYARVDGEEIE